MQLVWSDEIDSVLGVGKKLDNSGVHNWALARSEAPIALDRLMALGVPVLGGDVYTVSDAGLKLSYDNWYCDRLDDEPKVGFVIRSIAKAKDYIRNYAFDLGEVYFAIVPDVRAEP